MTCAETLARTLRDAGVTRLFGLPGGEILDFIDAARRTGIAFTLVRHEATASLLADALGQPREVRPGQAEALGDIVLKDGLHKAKGSREKQAQALVQPQELTRAAQDLFDKIRTAD